MLVCYFIILYDIGVNFKEGIEFNLFLVRKRSNYLVVKKNFNIIIR